MPSKDQIIERLSLKSSEALAGDLQRALAVDKERRELMKGYYDLDMSTGKSLRLRLDARRQNS